MASFSSFYGDGVNTTGNYSVLVNKTPLRQVIRKLQSRIAFGVENALLNAAIGAAAGETATKTYKRVAQSTSDLGGSRAIETVTVINRVTTAADITDLKTLLVTGTAPTTYARDLSGNGAR